LRRAHCQIVNTRHPSFLSERIILESRRLFPRILRFQNALLVVGSLARLQFV
jgi:hypothetical protein